jgi:hypothetical protein
LRRASFFSTSVTFVSLLPLDNCRCLSSIIIADLLLLQVSAEDKSFYAAFGSSIELHYHTCYADPSGVHVSVDGRTRNVGGK